MQNQRIRIAAIVLLLLALAVCVFSLARADGSGGAGTEATGQGFGGRGGGFAAGQGFGGSGENGAVNGGGPGARGGASPEQAPVDGQTAPTQNAPAAQAQPGQAAASPNVAADQAQPAQPGQSGQSGQSGQGGFGAGPGGRGGQGGGFAGGGTGRGGFSASSEGKSELVAYSVLFVAIAAVGAYAVFRRRAEVPAESRRGLIWLLLGTGLLLRIAVVPWVSGHQGDLNFFRTWATQVSADFGGFYKNGSADYPPLYMYVLYPIGKLLNAAPSALASYSTLLYKLPSLIADVATAGLLFLASRRYVSYTTGLFVALCYAFNPAVIVNSTYWGQVDSFFTLLVVGAVYLLISGRIGWASVMFMAGILMKPQGIIFAPVLFFGLVATRKLRPWLVAIGSAAATLLIVALPFSFGQSPLWLYHLYAGTVNEYPYATVNAYNLFALLGLNYKADTNDFLGLSYHSWGLLFIVLTTLCSWRLYARSRQPAFAAASAMLLISGVFTLSTGMHERYLFPAAALALLAYFRLQDRVLLWLAAGFSLTIFVNTFVILYQSGDNTTYSFPLWAISTLNVALFGSALMWAWGYVRTRRNQDRAELPETTA